MKLIEKYGVYKQRNNFFALVIGAILLVIGIIVTKYAILYASTSASYSLSDIILSNTRTYNVSWPFIFGPIIFWVIVGSYLFFIRPEKIPFLFKSLALFLVIRSFFICLTHLGLFPTHLIMNVDGILGFLNSSSGGDLFFSGHTGMPFLAGLIFWENKSLRIFSILASIFFGVIVLLGHIHYSIDVFAAFFITFSIYRLAEIFFKKDKLLADSSFF